MDFQPRHETTHLEQGDSFGVPRQLYCRLAQAGLSASQVGGIEPQLLEPLSDGRAGCLCTLFGQTYCFTIELVIEPSPIVTLHETLLDEPDAQPIVEGDPWDFATWRAIVRQMFFSEGWTPEILWERGYLMT